MWVEAPDCKILQSQNGGVATHMSLFEWMLEVIGTFVITELYSTKFRSIIDPMFIGYIRCMKIFSRYIIYKLFL